VADYFSVRCIVMHALPKREDSIFFNPRSSALRIAADVPPLMQSPSILARVIVSAGNLHEYMASSDFVEVVFFIAGRDCVIRSNTLQELFPNIFQRCKSAISLSHDTMISGTVACNSLA
jgi:hypothetical protein